VVPPGGGVGTTVVPAGGVVGTTTVVGCGVGSWEWIVQPARQTTPRSARRM
jgi:hypothetical protein